jgi:hypothetical protein
LACHPRASPGQRFTTVVEEAAVHRGVGGGADLDVTDSVAGMRRVLAAADVSMNGGFFNFDGERLPW